MRQQRVVLSLIATKISLGALNLPSFNWALIICNSGIALTFYTYRYHSSTTLRTLKAFRIGRKQMDPWPNMTPPIRGGIYRRLDTPASLNPTKRSGLSIPNIRDETCADGDQSDAELESLSACAHTQLSTATLRAATFDEYDSGISVNSGKDDDSDVGSFDDGTFIGPEEYTDWVLRQNVIKDLVAYPSVHPTVQQDIIRQYRLLHQQIRNEGLYDCPYIEYAKEMSRYGLLFIMFLVTLRREWYLTSAFFLGLFWVCSHIGMLILSPLLIHIIAPNYVHSARCWTSSYYRKLCSRYSHWHLHRRLLLWSLNRLVEEQS